MQNGVRRAKALEEHWERKEWLRVQRRLEGRINALIRAVCTDIHGPVENLAREFCTGCLLHSFWEEARGFPDLLKQKPSSLFILLDGAESQLHP
jgi:hypothetical protein